MSLTPKNWRSFQHYKDRAPVWIKLHRALLDNYEFQCLPVASRALAPMLWLLASEYEEGRISLSVPAMAFRLRMPWADILDALKPLIDGGFFVADSDMLAAGYPDAMPEKKEETQEKTETEKDTVLRTVAAVEEKIGKPKRGRKPSSKVPFPSEFNFEVRTEEEAREFERFRDSALAHDRRYADWNAAWRNWKSSPYNRGKPNGTGQVHAFAPRRGSREDTRERLVQALDQLEDYGTSGPDADGSGDGGEIGQAPISRIPEFKRS